MSDNFLYYGDNLKILREYIKDETIDLIYLDPPFNSKADYNILYKEPTGEPSKAQITAFEDTWHWTDETSRTFQEIINTAPHHVVEMMLAFHKFIGVNDVMAYLTMMAIRLIELKKKLKYSGSIYLHCDPTASHYLKILMDSIFGKSNFRNEIIWHYRRWPAKQKNFQRMHDVVLFYSKKHQNNIFSVLLEPLSEGTMKRWGGKKSKVEFEGNVRLVTQMTDEDSLGRPMDDVWDIAIINSQAKERLGYPTQKPELLLERIINSSSNVGDTILDPFCGCGTTIAVSERLKRNWIGIDITHLAINLIKLRMRDMFLLEPKRDYKVVGEPEDIQGAKELASQNSYQFQWWAISLIDNAMPYQDKKKGSDTGIDGILYFEGGKKAIIQVKSGRNIGVKDIRDLCHVVDREKAEIGIFITLKEQTRQMNTEALQKGYYKSDNGKDYLRIQILTINDLFAGKRPNVPLQMETFKKAQPISKTPTEEMDL